MGSSISSDPFVENVKVTLLGYKFDSTIENKTIKGINEVMMRDKGIESEDCLTNFTKWCDTHQLSVEDHSLLFQKFKEKINTLEFDFLIDGFNSSAFEKRILQLVRELNGEEKKEEIPTNDEIPSLLSNVFSKISKEDISSIEEKAKTIFSNLVKSIGDSSFLEDVEKEKEKEKEE